MILFVAVLMVRVRDYQLIICRMVYMYIYPEDILVESVHLKEVHTSPTVLKYTPRLVLGKQSDKGPPFIPWRYKKAYVGTEICRLHTRHQRNTYLRTHSHSEHAFP